jgi:type II secretory pathway pseudopilin PulG
MMARRYSACANYGRAMARGFTLIEVVIFIVVAGVLVAGVIVALGSSLRGSTQAGQTDLAAEIAQTRLELILAQKRATSFAAFADPCIPGPGPAACTPPTGYAVTSSIVTGWGGDPTNYKVVTVSVSGFFSASASALVSNY